MTNIEDVQLRAGDLDQVIHSPKRLTIMAILNTVAEAEFSYLRDRLDLADSDLSKQMSTLVKAKLVKVRKTGGGRSGKTWFSLTAGGKKAFRAYRETLRAIVELGD